MKKILLGLCVLSASSFSAMYEGNVNQGIEIPVAGTISVKNEDVISGNKIVIYKDGAVAGNTGISFNISVKKQIAIDTNATLNRYFIKKVPGSGLTETEIKAGDFHVPVGDIQVGAASSTGTLRYVALGTGTQHWSLSGLGVTNSAVAGTLMLKTGYDATAKNLKVYLDGTAGNTAGDLTLTAKFGVKVTN